MSDFLMSLVFMSEGIHVRDFDNRVRGVLNQFCRKRIQWKTTFRRGRCIRQPDRVYAASNLYRTEYFFHRHDWDELKTFLNENGIRDEQMNISKKGYRKAYAIEVQSPEHHQDRDYQADIISYALQKEIYSLTIPLQTGKGKSQPLTTPIRTPKGTVLMGDLKVGDALLTKEGTTQYVTGIHPQGKRAVYRLTFADGRTSESCIEHLWHYYNPNTGWQTTELKELLTHFEQDTNYQAAIPWYQGVARNTIRLAELRRFLDDYAEEVNGYLVIPFNDEVMALVRESGGIAEGYGGSHLRIAHPDPYYLTNDSYRVERLTLNAVCGVGLPITKIERLDKEVEMQCISVSGEDRLYVCDDYVVTHNTKTALRIIEELGCRAGIVSRLKHVKQWLRDTKEQFNLTDKDVFLVQGKDKLVKLINLAKEDKCPFKFIFFSNSTLQAYIKRCELGEWKDYGCKPQDLFQLLRIGVRIVDEAHECLHLNFKLAMYLHTKKTIYLSATILTGDEFINRMSEIIFPLHLRHDKLEWDKYIDVYALSYSHARGDMRYQHPGNPNYAHSALEQWYLNNPKALGNYFTMVGDLIENYYVQEYKDGLKTSVFCSFVEFATELTAYLEARFSDFSVGRYCATADDPIEHLYDVDIRVTTPESAGTGTDIDDLYLNICCVNVSSIQRNLQIQGRTRKGKRYPELTPKFIYLWATDIDKHRTAHEMRLSIFEGKAKNVLSVMSDYVI